jgi:hypothetical protein
MADDVDEAPDAWAGVSPEYKNYSEIAGKPFAAPGEDEERFNPTPDVVSITVNPDGTPAGVYAVQLAAQEAEADDETVGAESDNEDEVQTIEAPVNVVAPSVPVPPAPGE